MTNLYCVMFWVNGYAQMSGAMSLDAAKVFAASRPMAMIMGYVDETR